MVCVQSPLKREFIIELLHEKEFDGITFHFEKRDNMKLYFNHSGSSEQAAKVAKQTIKKSELGAALFFSVTYE